jgi:cytochrome c553
VRKSEIMQPIATKLTRQEIVALSSYFSNQTRTPGIVTNPKLIADGEVIFKQGNKESGVPACAGCHGPNGGGAPRFPALAAQNADYVTQQLQNFRSGARANDLGLLMRTVASRLTDQEILAVSQYVASLPPAAAVVSSAP